MEILAPTTEMSAVGTENWLGKSPLGGCQDLVCGDVEDLDSLWDLDGLKLEYGVDYSDRVIKVENLKSSSGWTVFWNNDPSKTWEAMRFASSAPIQWEE